MIKPSLLFADSFNGGIDWTFILFAAGGEAKLDLVMVSTIFLLSYAVFSLYNYFICDDDRINDRNLLLFVHIKSIAK